MNSTIDEWNTMINGSLAEIKSLNEEIAKAEAELAVLKNADANGYSQEINEKRKALIGLREKFEELKASMLDDGEEITEKLAAISSQKVKSISKQYSTVSQRVKSAGADPANPGEPAGIALSNLTIPEGLSIYISPVNELFHLYKNEIADICKIIAEWNVKMESGIAEYEALKTNLEPVESQLAEFEKNSKQHKEEISSLKDQQSAIEKEIKALEKRMENDGSKLSALIKEAGVTIQKTIAGRIEDIISGINFLYHQKLNV
jgi:chromosome segregation ATPase